MPAIRHPLMDVAAHIIEAKGVRLETPDLQRLRSVVGFIASLTICRISLQLVAPPKFSSSTPTRSVLPFGFAWKPERFVRHLRKPIDKFLCVSPAHICDRCLVLTRRNISTALRGHAGVPLTVCNWKFAYRKRPDRDTMDRFFRRIVVTPHSERPPGD